MIPYYDPKSALKSPFHTFFRFRPLFPPTFKSQLPVKNGQQTATETLVRFKFAIFPSTFGLEKRLL